MAILLGVSVALVTWAEMAGPGRRPHAAGGAMEGKEVRFGEAASPRCSPRRRPGRRRARSTRCTTRFTAPGGGVALLNMLLGEVAPGGVGSGLYGHADAGRGDRVPRRPDGRPDPGVPRQEDRPARDRAGRALRARHARARPDRHRAVAISADAGLAGLQEAGPHGFSEALYAFTSAANNNGSAFAGLTSGTPFWNTLLGHLHARRPVPADRPRPRPRRALCHPADAPAERRHPAHPPATLRGPARPGSRWSWSR